MDAILKRATSSAKPIAKTLPEVQYVDLDALCAKAEYVWNAYGITGSMSFYQAHYGEMLFDADFGNCVRDSRY